MRTILLIDDDADYLSLVSLALGDCGMRVIGAATAEAGLFELSRHAIDACVTDIRLPGLDGNALIAELRRRTPMPILAVSGADEAGEAAARRAGADDFMAKPTPVSELASRLRRLLDRAAAAAPERLEVGQLTVHVADSSVMLDGRAVDLTHLELRLLVALITPPLQVHSRERLHEELYGSGPVDLAQVDRVVDGLRAAIEKTPDRPRRIVRVVDSGYRYEP